VTHGGLALVAALGVLAAQGAAPDPLMLERGRAVYNFRCYFCHGYSGDSRTLAATLLATPPRDFQSTPPERLPRERIAAAVRDGVPGTGMQAFGGILDARDIAAVAAFVRAEFVEKRLPNTRYHTAANGWSDHERYRDAFPFARGDVALDADPASLSNAERRGRQLFVSACITCHDRGRPSAAGAAWERVGQSK